MRADEAELRERAHRLVSDLPYYAENVLKVRPKEGGLVPLVLNAVQRQVDDRIDAELAATGKARSSC